MLKKALPLILLLLVIFGLYAQDPERPMRKEIEVKQDADIYHLVPFGTNGVLLYYRSTQNNNGFNDWYFTLYDVNFKERWTKKFSISAYMSLKLTDKDVSDLYLFMQKSVNKREKDNFTILTVNIVSGEISKTEGINPDHSDITAFAVENGKAYLGGVTIPSKGAAIGQVFFTLTLVPVFSGLTLLRYHPSFFCVDLQTGKTISYPEKIKGQAWVDNLRVDSARNQVSLSIKNHIPRRKNFMFLNNYDAAGTRLSSVELSTGDPGRKLNSARMISLSDSVKIIIGTYNNKTSGYGSNDANNSFREGSSGFFIARVLNNQQQFIQYYNFAELKSFYQTLTDKGAIRLKKKAIRKKARGKEVELDYQMLLHDIIVRGNDLIFIAEAYYPEYHSETYTTYDAYGRLMTSTYTVFDGYRYTNAVICCFDQDGKLKWDNSFEIWNILSYNLSERVKVLFDGDDIVMTYSSEGEIASKIIRGNLVIESKDYTPIKSSYEQDKLISDYNSDMEYWYGPYFITFGYQKIKNTSKDGKSRRTVFYFNKIAFY